MDQQKAIMQMNKYGAGAVPFFFVIDYKANNAFVIKLSNAVNKNIFFKVGNTKNYINNACINKPVIFDKYPENIEKYQQSFKVVSDNLKKGNSFLTNLTCCTPIETNLSLTDIFYKSISPYKLFFKNRFVVFSPEQFVSTCNNKIYSYPMKGTINASVKKAAQKILANYKESAEHATITDLIRNDLSIVSDNVTVEKYRYINKVETNKGKILQVSSKISGQLMPGWQQNIGNIIFSMLPAGSISGAPKSKTLQIISDAETYKRGFYTGIFGVFNGTNVDSAVMIRFIEKTKNGLVYKSGGGITVYSNLVDEYNEMVDKIYLPFV